METITDKFETFNVEELVNNYLAKRGTDLQQLFALNGDLPSEYKEVLKRGHAIEKELARRTILFLGMNPSYSNDKVTPPGFYKEYKHPYFRRISNVTEVSNRSMHTTFPFAHHDIFFVRHTSQKFVEEMKDSMENFFDIQINITKQIIVEAEPKIIVVANAGASKIFQHEICKSWKPGLPQFDEELGVDFLEVEANGKSIRAPVLFTGMLSGQRALDDGSYYSLIWHITHILRNIDK